MNLALWYQSKSLKSTPKWQIIARSNQSVNIMLKKGNAAPSFSLARGQRIRYNIRRKIIMMKIYFVYCAVHRAVHCAMRLKSGRSSEDDEACRPPWEEVGKCRVKLSRGYVF